MSEQTEMTTELLGEILDAFNAHDLDRIVSHFDPDGEMRLPAGPELCGTPLKGHDEIREGLRQRFAAAPDVQWIEGRISLLGDRALTTWRVVATPLAGGRLDCQGCDTWEFRNGRIMLKDTYYKQVAG